MVDDAQAELSLAGTPTGALVRADELPAVMVQAAEAFLAERTEQQSEAWRLAELEDGPQLVLGRLGLGRISPVNEGEILPNPAPRSEAAGAVVVTVPLGVLGVEQAEVLAEVAEGGVRVTPWRSVVVPGVAVSAVVERLEAVGLVLDAGSAWNGVTSCAGRPGCGKARADVRGEARRVVPRLGAGRAVHWSGCERRCGRPGTEFVDVLALEDGGYSVDGVVGELDVEINKVRAL